MKNNLWTPVEDAVLMEPRTAREAAAIVGRSVKAVEHRRRRLVSEYDLTEDVEPAGWPVPAMGLCDQLACVQMRKWARDVAPANNLTWRIRA